jgi:peptidoglycan hydrolase CwlO-like protein
MDTATLLNIVAIITGLSGGGIAIATAVLSARKSELESLRATVNTLQATIKTLQDENQRLGDRIDELEKENLELRCELDKRGKRRT